MDLQCSVYLSKCLLSLIKEIKDYGGTEVVLRRLVHFQNLTEGAHIQGVTPHIVEGGKLIHRSLDGVSSLH